MRLEPKFHQNCMSRFFLRNSNRLFKSCLAENGIDFQDFSKIVNLIEIDRAVLFPALLTDTHTERYFVKTRF